MSTTTRHNNQEQLPLHDLPNITVENVQAVYETARSRYVSNIRETIKRSIEQAYAQMCFTTELLYSELEAGSKELAISRELLFHVNNKSLTAETWSSLINRLDSLRKEQVTAAEAAKVQMQ